MMPALDASEAATRIGRALDAAGIDHAIGGALALGVHGVPRGTLDVDLNVFVPEERLGEVFDVLRRVGVAVDTVSAMSAARAQGMFIGNLDGMRIDVFVPSIPFSDEAGRTRVRIASPDGGADWFLAPEALSVFKLLFARPKDFVDLERLVAVQGGALDRAYVRRWIADMMGDDDERVRKWDALVGELGGGGSS
jgi:hypothetical protein